MYSNVVVCTGDDPEKDLVSCGHLPTFMSCLTERGDDNHTRGRVFFVLSSRIRNKRCRRRFQARAP